MPAAAVEFAEPDYRVSVNWMPNDALLSLQWHHSVIGSPAAWQSSTGKGDIKVRWWRDDVLCCAELWVATWHAACLACTVPTCCRPSPGALPTSRRA